MKKIILFLPVLVLLLSGCSDAKRLSGVWECSHYALYNEYKEEWSAQPAAFRNLFGMRIGEDSSIVMNIAGKDVQGHYVLQGDTLVMDIDGDTSRFVWDRRELRLTGRPRVRVHYTKSKRKPEE
jgi:uncharacterized protein YceK